MPNDTSTCVFPIPRIEGQHVSNQSKMTFQKLKEFSTGRGGTSTGKIQNDQNDSGINLRYTWEKNFFPVESSSVSPRSVDSVQVSL